MSTDSYAETIKSMFRVVEDADGTTHIYRTSTNKLLCTVDERATRCRPSGEDAVRRSPKEANGAPPWAPGSPDSRSASTPDDVLAARAERTRLGSEEPCPKGDPSPRRGLGPPTQEEFLGRLYLIPAGTWETSAAPTVPEGRHPVDGCVPVTCLRERERVRRPTDEDVAGSIRGYEKCCSVRFLLRTPTFNGFPVVYRGPRKGASCHVYCFGPEQRRERSRYLATGLNGRARKLRANCRPAVVAVRRLTSAEIAMWRNGRLSRAALDNIPGCLKPRCVVSDVRDLVSDGAVSQVPLSPEARARLNVPVSPNRRRLSKTTGKENVCRDGWKLF